MIEKSTQEAADVGPDLWRRAALSARLDGPPGEPPADAWEIDVTYRDLAALGSSPKVHLQVLMEYLKSAWVGDNPDREWNCRIGTLHAWVDREGTMHIDVVPRFGNRPADLMERLGDVARQIKDEEEDLAERGMGLLPEDDVA